MPLEKKIICQFNPEHIILTKNGRQTKFCLNCGGSTGWYGPPTLEEEFALRFNGEKLDTGAPEPGRA